MPNARIRTSFCAFSFFLILFSMTSASASWLEVPGDQQTLVPIGGEARETDLPAPFDLLVWNVHKGEDGNTWARDYKTLAAESHVILLQEGMRDEFMPRALTELQDFAYWIAISFLYSDQKTATGVISGFRASPARQFFLRSPDREPITSTPKMTLLSVLRLREGGELLIANLHGINFVTNDSFRRQIEQVVPALRDFQGPVIFAGDFNTWNPGRQRFLDESLAAIGMKELHPVTELTGLRLDHIYQRGCEQSEAWIRNDISSSDHKPIRARMLCRANGTSSPERLANN